MMSEKQLQPFLKRIGNINSYSVIELNKDEVIIGRDLNVSFRIDSLWISRRHALLKKENKAWFIKDLNSLNGICINKTKLKSGVVHELSDRDIIRFGPLDIDVQYEYVFHDGHSEEDSAFPLQDKSSESMHNSFFERLKEENEVLTGRLEMLHNQYENREKDIKDVHEQIEKLQEENRKMKDELKLEFERELTAKEGQLKQIILEQNANAKSESMADSAKLKFDRVGSRTGCNVLQKTKISEKALSDKEVALELLSELTELSSQKEGNSQASAVGRSNVLDEFNSLIEAELECAICTELFINAVTLSCSHSFCKFCLDKWKNKGGKSCPTCLQRFTSEAKSLVLDTFIERIIEKLPDEKVKGRQKIKDERMLACNKQSDSKRKSSPSVSSREVLDSLFDVSASSRQLRRYCHCGTGQRHYPSSCPARAKRQKRTRSSH